MRQTFLTLLVLVLLGSPGAHAQALRTWVSGVGDDANPGSRTAPCRTFAGAFSKTATGGEIDVLDPGSFGPVTLTKSLTLNGGGELAGISPASPGQHGIVVAAGSTGTVTLRRLSLQGLGTGGTAIRITGARRVVVEECFINGWETGIDIATTSTCEVVIRDSSIRGGVAGVALSMTGADSRATLDRCQVTGTTNGVLLAAGTCDVNASLVSQNAVALRAQGGVLNSFSNVLAGNGQDVQYSGGGSVRTFNNLGPVSMTLRQDTTVTNVDPGTPAVFHLTLTPPPGGFPADVAFSTAGLPAGLVCAFDPLTVPAGSGTTAITMTVAEASARQAHGFLPPWIALGLLAAAGGALAGTLLAPPGRRLATCLPMLVLALALAVPGCGGGSSGAGSTASTVGNRAPLTGTFPFTVTATSGGTSVSQQFTASFR